MLSEAYGVLVAPRISIHYWYCVVSVALDRRVYCVTAGNWSFFAVLTSSCMQPSTDTRCGSSEDWTDHPSDEMPLGGFGVYGDFRRLTTSRLHTGHFKTALTKDRGMNPVTHSTLQTDVDYCWHCSLRSEDLAWLLAISCGGSKSVNRIVRLAVSTFVFEKERGSGVSTEYWDVWNRYPQQHHFHVVELKSSAAEMCFTTFPQIVVVSCLPDVFKCMSSSPSSTQQWSDCRSSGLATRPDAGYLPVSCDIAWLGQELPFFEHRRPFLRSSVDQSDGSWSHDGVKTHLYVYWRRRQ